MSFLLIWPWECQPCAAINKSPTEEVPVRPDEREEVVVTQSSLGEALEKTKDVSETTAVPVPPVPSVPPVPLTDLGQRERTRPRNKKGDKGATMAAMKMSGCKCGCENPTTAYVV